MRVLDSIPKGVDDANPFPFVKRAFETIALAKVATSAEEARTLGFLSADDPISMNADRLIADAKKEVLALAASGYVEPQQRKDILALGISALADFETGYSPDEAGRIYFRSRCGDWNAASPHSDGRRSESSDARFRAIPVGPRTRSVPFACRQTQDAGADRAHVEDREATEKLSTCGLILSGRSTKYKAQSQKRKSYERGSNCFGSSDSSG